MAPRGPHDDRPVRRPPTWQERFRAQVRFAPLGSDGQRRLAAARVLIVGVGATGCAEAVSLARAGVGRLTLVDRDYPEVHNLPRQILFTDDDVELATPKAVAAARHLAAMAPGLETEAVVADFHAGNAKEIVAGHDLVLDGTDNFAARYVMNDSSLAQGVPWIYCAVVGGYGLTMTIEASGAPCLRCFQDEAPPPGTVETCDTAGVLHGAVMTVAGVAVIEAIKVLSGTPRRPGITFLDPWAGEYRRFEVPPREDCRSCARGLLPALTLPESADVMAAALCGRDAVHLRPGKGGIDLATMAGRLEAATEVTIANEHLVRFSADGQEVTLFADGRAIVKGTSDTARARGIYARYVGA